MNHKASLACFVDEGYAGRGSVPRAARALLAPAFGTLAIRRMELRCVTNNAASIVRSGARTPPKES